MCDPAISGPPQVPDYPSVTKGARFALLIITCLGAVVVIGLLVVMFFLPVPVPVRVLVMLFCLFDTCLFILSKLARLGVPDRDKLAPTLIRLFLGR